jgi:hypothetical protein
MINLIFNQHAFVIIFYIESENTMMQLILACNLPFICNSFAPFGRIT